MFFCTLLDARTLWVVKTLPATFVFVRKDGAKISSTYGEPEGLRHIFLWNHSVGKGFTELTLRSNASLGTRLNAQQARQPPEVVEVTIPHEH